MAFSPIWSPRGAWLNFSHFLVSYLKLRGRLGVSTALQTHWLRRTEKFEINIPRNETARPRSQCPHSLYL
jgi:hypothetical protein